MKNKNGQDSFESMIERLEEISELLDSNEIGLDESIKLYEEGIEISKKCFSKLKEAELKVSVLKKSLNGTLEESDFEE